MFYIHQATCISPMSSDATAGLIRPAQAQGNRILVKEPTYEGVPSQALRRMGKSVRLGVGVCLPLLRAARSPVSGILIGTANGGTEESFRFLRQLVEYGEELLSPSAFVQSTANALASQISLMERNRGYNSTHVHRGLAFEQALTDAALLSNEVRDAWYLLAGIDELSYSNFILDGLQGWHKPEDYNGGFYDPLMPGTIAGEGAAGFLLSGRKQNALARLAGISTLHSSEVPDVIDRLHEFLSGTLPPGHGVDLLLSGENGDSRLQKYYSGCEEQLPAGVPVARYKHCCGEYPTASAMGLWIACRLLSGSPLPEHLVKRGHPPVLRHVLIYNNYKGKQHSFMLVSGKNH